MTTQHLVTTLVGLPEIPPGSTFASVMLTAEFMSDSHGGLRHAQDKLTRQLGQEPDVVALFDREQAEWLLSAAQPGVGPDDRVMIAVALSS